MDDEIRIRADLEGALARDLTVAAEAADELGDQAGQTAVQLQIMEAAAAGASREVRGLDRDTRTAAQRQRDLNAVFGGGIPVQRAYRSEVDKSTGTVGRLLAMLDKFSGRKFSFAKLLSVYKIPAVVLAVTLLAGAVSAVGAAGFASVAGLSPLVALLGGLPSLVTSGIQALAAVKVGLSGVGDAVKALREGDPAKIREAMEGLTAEGQVLARTFARLVDGPLGDIRDATQSAIAPGLTRSLKNLGPLFPVVERGLSRTGRMLGGLAEEATRAMASPFFRGELRRIMEANDEALYNGGRAGIFMLKALVGIADAFRPVQVAISEYVEAGAAYVAAQVRMGQRSGELTDFFQRAWGLAKDVGSVLRDVAVALYNIGRESDVMSDALGGGLKQATADWRAWTESVAGKNEIRAWFTDALPVVQQMLGLIGDLGRMFGGLAGNAELAPLIAQIRGELLPAIQGLTAGVVTDLGPALITAAEAFAKFLSLLTWSPLVELLDLTVTGLDGLLSLAHALPGPVKFLAASILALSVAMRAAAFFGGMAFRAVKPLSPIFAPIGAGAREGSRGIGFFNRAAGGAMGAVGGLRAAGGQLVSAMGGPWVIGIMAAVSALGFFISKQREGEARVQALRDSLDSQTAALTKQSREIIANELEKEGAYKAAEGAGVRLADVTRAMMGDQDAWNRVMETTNGLLEQYDYLEQEAAASGTELSTSVIDSADAAQDLRGVMIGLHQDVDSAVNSQRRLIAGQKTGKVTTGELDNATRRLKSGQMISADAAERTGKALHDQRRATDAVRRATINLNNVLEARATYVGFRQAVLSATETLKKGKRTLDLHTQAGIDNWNALKDMATAADEVKNAAKRQEALREARRRIQEWGASAKIGKDRAEDLWKEFLEVERAAKKIPNEVEVRVAAEGWEATLQHLNAIRDAGIRAQNAADGGTSIGNPDATPRREGGPVWQGHTFKVGEIGAELLVKASGETEIVGRTGPQERRFDQPGMIFPTKTLRALEAAATREAPRAAGRSPVAVAPAAPAPSSGSVPAGGGESHLHVHFDGDAIPDEAAARRAARAAYREWQRQREELRIEVD